jgi:hypothetical protein
MTWRATQGFQGTILLVQKKGGGLVRGVNVVNCAFLFGNYLMGLEGCLRSQLGSQLGCLPNITRRIASKNEEIFKWEVGQ